MIDINIINDYGSLISFNSKLIQTLIKKILLKYDINTAQISLILSNKILLNKLKKDYFYLDQFTDVIAFNLEDDGNPLDGEIYISIDDILENSENYRVSFNDEFKRIIIHGTLHLLGFNDKTKEEKEQMTELENINMKIISEEIIFYKKK